MFQVQYANPLTFYRKTLNKYRVAELEVVPSPPSFGVEFGSPGGYTAPGFLEEHSWGALLCSPTRTDEQPAGEVIMAHINWNGFLNQTDNNINVR